MCKPIIKAIVVLSGLLLSGIINAKSAIANENDKSVKGHIFQPGVSAVTGGNATWLPSGKNDHSGVKEVNSFLDALSGRMRLIAVSYNGSSLAGINTIRPASGNKGWNAGVNTSAYNDFMKIKVLFSLKEGKTSESGVGVAFDFYNWRTENYVMIPAVVYNANRCLIVDRGYAAGLDRQYLYRKEIPLMSAPVPQLSPDPGKSSRLELTTSNSATPAICFLDRKLNKAFILLAEQGTTFGDNGLIIEESLDRKQASLIVTAPGVRERKPAFVGFTASPDRGAVINAGDSLTMNLVVYCFDANEIPGLLDRFVSVRSSLTGRGKPRDLIPMSEVARLMTGRIDSRYYDNGKFRFYCPENAKWISFGWIGGLMNTYPMLALNDGFHLERVAGTFDFAIPRAQGESGYFYGALNYDGKNFGREGYDELPEIVLTRKNADVLYWMVKQFRLLKLQDRAYAISPAWEGNIKRLADAFCNTWRNNGQWGRMLNNRTGDVAEFNTTGGAMVPAALALASAWYNMPGYMSVAREAAEFYYTRDVLGQGQTTGGCADILHNADSESAMGLLTSMMTLYEMTGEQDWLDKAKVLANLTATWVVSYDYALPEETQLAKLGAHLAGAVWASTQNKHSAPGACTTSSDPFFKLYRQTGDARYADILREIIHAHSEGIQPNGMITERLGYCDADETRGSRGTHTTGWCELNGFLMALEIPGIYLRTDINLLYVFDHVKIADQVRSSNGVVFNVSNPTAFDATVSILAEDNEKAARPLGINAFPAWERITLRPGETKKLSFSIEGKLLLTETI